MPITDSPGTLGSISEKVSDTSLALTVGAACSVGTFVVVVFGCDNAGASTPTLSIADSKSNAWTIVHQGINTSNTGAAASVAGMLAVSKLTVALTTSDTITVTLSNAVTAKSMAARGFQGVNSTTPREQLLLLSTGSSPGSSNPTTLNGDLVVGWITGEDNVAPTADTDTTNGSWSSQVSNATTGGGAAANVVTGYQFKIVNADGGQTYSATTGGDNIAGIAVFAPIAQANPIPQYARRIIRPLLRR